MGASPMPMPNALFGQCPVWPMPARAPHVTEKGYIYFSRLGVDESLYSSDFNRQVQASPSRIFDSAWGCFKFHGGDNRKNQGDSRHTLIVSSKLPLIRVLS